MGGKRGRIEEIMELEQGKYSYNKCSTPGKADYKSLIQSFHEKEIRHFMFCYSSFRYFWWKEQEEGPCI
jgi:hypothetical protein